MADRSDTGAGEGAPFGIFICYRRSDTVAGHADRLRIELKQQFPDAEIFFDVESMPRYHGLLFTDVIEETISSCDVLLAMIGTEWAAITKEREQDTRDWVRREIAAALERDIRVVPLLVEGAVMPDELPEEIADLAEFQAQDIRNKTWDHGVRVIADMIREAQAEKGLVARPEQLSGREGGATLRDDQKKPLMLHRIVTANCDVTEFPCDVLVMKYAQSLYGADFAVVSLLGLTESDVRIRPGDHLVVRAKGAPFGHVLLLGVPDLATFGYGGIRKFATDALHVASGMDVAHAHVAMTMHGVGYGLDEREAFTAQVAGILEYFSAQHPGESPEQVTIVERDAGRFRRVSALLDDILAGTTGDVEIPGTSPPEQPIPDAGISSDSKRFVFVAMPYNDEMTDVFEFGIREPVNNAGCLCERCDREVFTGDVLDRIKNRIAEADVVIADMTGSNPNVYLEVGFAWGKGVQTLLVAREGEELMFDVKTHRCLYYKNINHLRKQLTDFMAHLMVAADDV